MPAATTSGSDAKPNGAAKSRDHNQGNQDRSFTPEQKSEVIRIRRCQPTAFYDILNLESVKTTVTDTEIKKAYRKISLLTHPDKNGHEHAAEAFKMVSRAFGILGDKDKRATFDRTGGDPDSRFGGGAPPSNPFSGFAGRPQASRAAGGGGGSMWEEEISPEEMFNRFFGGGGGFGGFGGGGGGLFDGGQQFMFNMGGGPGIRVHQFGGGRPRRRPRDPNAPPEAPASLQSTLIGLLPLFFILVLPLLSSILGGSGTTSNGPTMRFDAAVPPHTVHRHTSRMKVDYYLDPAELEGYTQQKLKQLDQKAEVHFVQRLTEDCHKEEVARQDMINQAQGWFFPDAEKMQAANNLEMKNCRRLRAAGYTTDNYYRY